MEHATALTGVVDGVFAAHTEALQKDMGGWEWIELCRTCIILSSENRVAEITLYMRESTARQVADLFLR